MNDQNISYISTVYERKSHLVFICINMCICGHVWMPDLIRATLQQLQNQNTLAFKF